MKKENQNNETDYKKYLPIYGALKNNHNVKWIVFGTFTSGVPRSPKTLIKIFKSIIHQIGMLNNSYERRLHYVARCEKHLSGDWHIHFLLGGHKIIDGENSRITINEACEYLDTLWNDYGIADVEEYDKNKKGLEYILKKRNDDEHDDPIIVSSALLTMLKNDKVMSIEQELNENANDDEKLIKVLMSQMNKSGKVLYRVSELPQTSDYK
jgi:hypothetical protein